jgi:hypothetical protein
MSRREPGGAEPDGAPRPADFGLPETPAFTVQGQIERTGLFASGTKRANGWAKVALYVLVYGTAALLIAGVVIGLLNHRSLGQDPTQEPTPVTPTGP